MEEVTDDNTVNRQKNNLTNVRWGESEVEQVSAITYEPVRRAASQQTCCKQRTLSVINLRLN